MVHSTIEIYNKLLIQNNIMNISKEISKSKRKPPYKVTPKDHSEE